tara:strand:+ start:197 stop:670 length:474 start_codon:yes stop_codon:yes gene_type:complete
MNYVPQHPQTYIGNQVLINSDRLIFNAKNDSILLFSDKAIGFSTNGSFHFDTSSDKEQSKFIVNSPNIYLGLDFDNTLPKQSAVLAEDLIVILNEILDIIQVITLDMCFNVSHLTTLRGEPTGMNVGNDTILQRRIRTITGIRNDLEDIKSQNTKLV